MRNGRESGSGAGKVFGCSEKLSIVRALERLVNIASSGALENGYLFMTLLYISITKQLKYPNSTKNASLEISSRENSKLGVRIA